MDGAPSFVIGRLCYRQRWALDQRVTESCAVLVTLLYFALISTFPVNRVRVETVNDALVAPAATVTLDGVLASRISLFESVTFSPPAGAGALNATVPVDLPPAFTEVGFSDTDDSVTAGVPVTVN